MITLLALPLALLGMQQQGIADRLAGRVPPDVAALVAQLGAGASARGLPIDPLIQKAIEGSAKGIPSQRVADAVLQVATQLDEAAAALRESAISDTVAIAAGAFAINAGMNGHDIVRLVGRGGPPAEVTIRLRVAGTLTALGVPPAQAVELVTATLDAGHPAADLLALPGRVQAEAAKGVPPAQAAAGLARAAAAQARHGPPPGRGNPTRPQPPPHP